MPNSGRPNTVQQASRGAALKPSQSSKRSASGLVDSLISSFAGTTAAGSSNTSSQRSASKGSSPRSALEYAAAGAGSSSPLRCSSPLQNATIGSMSPSPSPGEDAAAAGVALGPSVSSCAGAASASAPVTPSSRSFTEPGTLGTHSQGGSLVSSRSLLPDAVFLPGGVWPAAGTPLKYGPGDSSSSSSAAPPADGSSRADGAAASDDGRWAGLAGSLDDLPAFNSSFVGSGSAAGGQLLSSSAAAASSTQLEPPAKQKSRVSFLVAERNASGAPGGPGPSGASTAGNSGSGGGGTRGIGCNRPPLLALSSEDEAALNRASLPHASDLKRSKTTALADIESSSADGGTGGSSSSSSSTAKQHLTGFKAVLHKLTAAVMDGSSSNSNTGASGQVDTRRQGESSSSGTSEPRTPGGSSKAHAQAYKQHHGYLPSPTASSGGSLSRVSLSKVSKPGSALLRAASLNFDSLAVDAAAVVSRSAAQQQEPAQPGSPHGQELLPALPPGSVPVFGAARAALTCSSSSSCTVPQMGLESALASSWYSSDALSVGGKAEAGSGSGRAPAAPGVRGLASQESSSSAQQQPDVRFGVQHPLMHAPRPIIELAPAGHPEPVLLAVSTRLAPAMQRPRWALSDFKILKKLYDGYASTICKAQDRVSGATVALKFYHLSKLNSISSHQVAREVRLHIDLDHENIIELFAAFQEAGSVVLVQDFAPGGDLWSFIDANSGRLTERVTVSLVLQPFLRALQYLHSAGIAHRDIKPENCLFSASMVLKVADFGLAVNLREERAVTRVGTLDYMAPEVLKCPLKRHPGDNKDNPRLAYQQSVDTWAAGVLAYELLTGRAPFSASGASDSAIEAAIKTSAPAFPGRMSEPAREFIAAALNKAPDKRPSILHMLQHPWIRSFQRSSSNGRAERRGSQELGGDGRLLLPSAVTSAAASRQQHVGQHQHGLLPQLKAQGPGKMTPAASVYHSDDLGMTGYGI